MGKPARRSNKRPSRAATGAADLAGVAVALVAAVGDGVAVAGAGVGAGCVVVTAGGSAAVTVGGAATDAVTGAALVAGDGNAATLVGAGGVRGSALAAAVGADFVAAWATSLAAAFAAASFAAVAATAARCADDSAPSAAFCVCAAGLGETVISGAPSDAGAACGVVAAGVGAVAADASVGAGAIGCVAGGVAARAKNHIESPVATSASAPSASGRPVELERRTCAAAGVERTAAARSTVVAVRDATRGASDSASPSAANRLSAASTSGRGVFDRSASTAAVCGVARSISNFRWRTDSATVLVPVSVRALLVAAHRCCVASGVVSDESIACDASNVSDIAAP